MIIKWLYAKIIKDQQSKTGGQFGRLFRHGNRSTIITSQLPVVQWYEVIGEQTVADDILDRIVHDAHRLELLGESLRKRQKTKINEDVEQNEKYVNLYHVIQTQEKDRS